MRVIHSQGKPEAGPPAGAAERADRSPLGVVPGQAVFEDRLDRVREDAAVRRVNDLTLAPEQPEAAAVVHREEFRAAEPGLDLRGFHGPDPPYTVVRGSPISIAGAGANAQEIHCSPVQYPVVIAGIAD